MVARNLNWNDIRPINNSLNEGFEELVCQLAKLEKIEGAVRFIRNGKPDAGVECYWILDNEVEIGWQAKFFINSFDAAQWRQIDNSVKVTLEKHPKLKKYIIALPVDPSDARVENQKSMFEKWEDHVTDWKKQAAASGMDVDFEAWWNSDLITKIQTAGSGFLYFWFNKEEFSNEWFIRQNDLAISDLGTRYTPELNQEIPISRIFDGLSRNATYAYEISRMYSELSQVSKKVIDGFEKVKDIELLKEHIDKLDKNILNYNPVGIDVLNVVDMQHSISIIKEEAYLLLDEIRSCLVYSLEYSYLRDLIRSILDAEQLINSRTVALANNPFLVLTGAAGCGKSHLLGDSVAKRKEDGLLSVFMLGTYFSTGEDPWWQIIKHCDIKCGVEEFLCSLNLLAQIRQSRIIFFIDAVNEGNGKNLWQHYIGSFIERLKSYEWLGLVMSVRRTYKELIFSDSVLVKNKIECCEHRGFEDVTDAAVKRFFTYYGLERINSPLLEPEFNNPLFLSLFCQGLSRSGYTRVPPGKLGITKILDLYMSGINRTLSDRLDYDCGLKIVHKAVETLAIARIDNNNQPLTVDAAAIHVNRICQTYGIANQLFKALLDEHVITKDLGGEANEVVEFSYERLQDYYSASYMVNNVVNVKSAFQKGGAFYYVVDSQFKRQINTGLFEALAILLPEVCGVEIFEVMPFTDEYDIASAYVDSLIWREPNTISIKNIRNYINDVVLTYPYLGSKLWDVILQMAAVPNHPLNAEWLHEHLMKSTMADRDAWWTIWLKRNYSSNSTIGKVIQWGYDTKCNDPETIKLISIALAWFHTSTNRELRDRSTKALIFLLNRRIDILIDILTMFEEVDDPYVLERLYAVAYGCVLQNAYTVEHFSSLVNYIYSTVFDKDEVYPHVLLRDYARNTIEYYLYKGNVIDFPIEKIRPPYKSEFNFKALTNEELDKKYSPGDVSQEERYRYAAQNILDSMTTEYGRGCCCYGDFGRYTFEYILENWKVDCNELSNIAVEWIFDKYGYDADKHGVFDRTIGSSKSRRSEANERIGKKYQWIAFHEMLARVSDNCEMIEDRWPDNAVVPYKGPWNPYIRDIDPSLLIENTNDELSYEIANWVANKKVLFSDSPILEWVKDDTDIPCPVENIEFVDDDGVTWVSLVNFVDWEEKHDDENYEPYKFLWQSFYSYIIEEDKFESFLEWVQDKAIHSRVMPNILDRYELFEREYYWSPAYEDLCMPSEKKCVFEEDDYQGANPIFDVYMTCMTYMWEAENDHSKVKSISFIKPSRFLFDGIAMSDSGKVGIWNDTDGNRICFNTSVWHGTNECLLIRKKELLEFLEKHHLKIVWHCIGGKVSHNYYSRTELYDPIEFSGFYYFDEKSSLVGNYKSQLVRSRYDETPQSHHDDLQHDIDILFCEN